MKFIICAAVIAAALLGTFAAIEAFPQQATFQHLPYYPPPTQAPQPMRVRRQVLGGEVSSNSNGGSNVALSVAKGVGTPDHLVAVGLTAAGNTLGGPVGTGAVLAYKNNGNVVTVGKENIPGIKDTLSQSALVNVLRTDSNIVTANAFASQNKLGNGFKFERNGVGLDWANKDGHGASGSLISIPNFGKQVEFGGNAKLFENQDTRLHLTGGGSKWLSGPFSGQASYNGGLDLSKSNGFGASAIINSVPKFGEQLGLGARANLWESADHNTRLNFNAGTSKWLNGPLRGETSYGGGIGLNHYFG